MVQSKSIPPTSHSALRINGPRTTKRKAVPTSRNPTTLLTPEQAETTLRLNTPPLWRTENTPPLRRPSNTAKWVTLTIRSMANNVAEVNALRTPSRTD